MRSLSSSFPWRKDKMFRRKTSSGKKSKADLSSSSVDKDDDSNEESLSEDISRRDMFDKWEPGELLRELTSIPLKQELRMTVDTISVMKDYNPILFKWMEWSLFFLIGYFGWSYAWLVCLLLAYQTYKQSKEASEAATKLSAQCSSDPEKDVLQSRLGLDSFPSWVVFPDFDRVEWINVVLKKVWPHIGPASKLIAKRIVEPRINRLLTSAYKKCQTTYSH